MKINIFFPFLWIILFLSSCSTWGQKIPTGKIIYMPPYDGLGFIQPSGDANEVLNINEKLDKPVWSFDGKSILGLTGAPGAFLGYPAVWDIENGKYKVCGKNRVQFGQIQDAGDPENPHAVVILGTWDIFLLDMSSCKQLKIFVDYSKFPGKYALAGFSYFHATSSLVYGLVINPDEANREYQLNQLNIKTGIEGILAEGINPAWSHDGKQIAYLGLDGLHVMNLDITEDKLILEQSFF